MRTSLKLINWIVWAAGIVAVNVSCASQARAPSDRAQIMTVLKRVVASENAKDVTSYREAGWPNATFTVKNRDEPKHKTSERQSWQNPVFAGTGVQVQSRLAAVSFRVGKRRALVLAHEIGQTLFLNEDGEYTASGDRLSALDRVVFEMRRGKWRVLAWERVISSR